MVRTFGLTHVALAVRDVDPDGDEFEIWFELQAPVDPPAPSPAVGESPS